MATQFTNFLGHGEKIPDYSGIANVFQNALQGYKVAKEPEAMERTAEKEKLANAMQQLVLQHKPREMQLSDALKQAQIKNYGQKASGAGLNLSGDIGNQYKIDQLRKTDPEQADRLQTALDSKNKLAQDKADRQRAYTNSLAFRSLPAAEKERTIAFGVGMGLDPSAVSNRLIKGDTLEDIANDKGFTLSEIDPSYALTGAEIRDTRRRKAFDEEMKTLNKRITEGYAPYAQKFRGYNFNQIVDSVSQLRDPSKETSEKLGKFLAARALSPELAGLRMNAMGGRVGIEGINHLTDVSLGKTSILEGAVDEQTFRAFQKYMNEYISEAIDSYNNVIRNSASLGRGGQISMPQQVEQQSAMGADPLGLFS